MTISQRLRTCAKHTGLDAVIELLTEAADEIDALQARAQVQGEPATIAVDHFDNGPFEAYTNRIYPHVEIGTKLYTTPQPAQAMQAEAQQPATGEPVMDVRCEGCGYMTHHREHMGCVRAAKQHTHPAPSVPDDVVRVPLQVLKDASEALGNFVSDHGWGDDDMQAMDNLDAYIARHEANRAAMLAAKKASA